MKRNWLEWTILVASVVTILALVGYLLLETIRGSAPAQLVVEGSPGDGRDTPAGWILPITVRNVGDQAAASVVIEASATVAGEEATAEVTIDLVPGLSEAEASVGFEAAPEGEVTFRVVGFESP